MSPRRTVERIHAHWARCDGEVFEGTGHGTKNSGEFYDQAMINQSYSTRKGFVNYFLRGLSGGNACLERPTLLSSACSTISSSRVLVISGAAR
jgi:hypothetical protein